MTAQRPDSLSANANGRPAFSVSPDTGHGAVDELAELLIEELEPRLTPDGPFGSSTHNNEPPGGQVGWGC
jgi:hypothetical protein